jgi:ubiquitin-like protein Nedd8
VDELWHALVLDTQVYAKLQRAIVMTLHHRPSGPSDEVFEARASRLRAMKEIYGKFYSSDPIESVPRQPNPAGLTRKPIVIHVKTLTGERLKLCVNNLDAVHEVKELIHDKTFISPGRQRLIFAGKQLADDRILVEYSIDKGAILILVVPPC